MDAGGTIPGKAESSPEAIAAFLSACGRRYPAVARMPVRSAKLYTEGDGHGGPLGVKQLAVWLNERGDRTKRGRRFGVSAIHTILTNRAYIGEAAFNRRSSKTLRQKPEDEHVHIRVPAIIDPPLFDRARSSLRVRNPRVTAPRRPHHRRQGHRRTSRAHGALAGNAVRSFEPKWRIRHDPNLCRTVGR